MLQSQYSQFYSMFHDYQVHDVEFAQNLDIIINETLPALQKIKESGKAKFIGITGYPLEPLKLVNFVIKVRN